MTDDTILETTIREPSMTAGEAEMLLFALERSRAQIAWKCGGLVKHLALVEDWTAARKLHGQSPGAPWDAADFESEPDWEWRTGAGDPPEELYALWRAAVARSRAAIAEVLADGGLDQPSRLTTDAGESPNVRRILVDLHDEYARHVGHADLLREAVDGLVGEDPPQP